MTDRELLELAAKAAGNGFVIGYWNPLTDDGDALRLAKRRKMTIAFEPTRGGWSVGAVVNDEFRWLAWDEDCCRAIVRAAAEIERNME
jgi:hypothetical protein